jgi:hypothetical protein
LHSVLSSTAFSSLFGNPQALHKSPSTDTFQDIQTNSSIPNINALSRSLGDLSKRQRAATTSDLVNSSTIGKSNECLCR